MNLGKYFTKSEFEHSQTATRKGINNAMPEVQQQSAILLCQNILDPIRVHYNKPVIITSGFRCKKLNRLIGGSTRSQHCQGKAADFWVVGIELKTVFNDIVKGDIPLEENFDQLIFEFGSWIHISRNDEPRGQRLLAQYRDSKAVYEFVEEIA